MLQLLDDDDDSLSMEGQDTELISDTMAALELLRRQFPQSAQVELTQSAHAGSSCIRAHEISRTMVHYQGQQNVHLINAGSPNHSEEPDL